VKHHGNGLELSKVANSWLLLRYSSVVAFSKAWSYDITNYSAITGNDALALWRSR
jgi:hypothetical protein